MLDPVGPRFLVFHNRVWKGDLELDAASLGLDLAGNQQRLLLVVLRHGLFALLERHNRMSPLGAWKTEDANRQLAVRRLSADDQRIPRALQLRRSNGRVGGCTADRDP